MKRIWLLAFLICSPLWATTYYLRADGTVAAANKANATSCSAAGSAMNITQHNAATFAAGDTIIACDTGGTFRTLLTPPTAGSSGSPITYSASGTPVFSGADLFSSWTLSAVSGSSWTQKNLNVSSGTTTVTFTNALTNPSLIVVYADSVSVAPLSTPTGTGNTFHDCGPGNLSFYSYGGSTQCWYALNTSTTSSYVITVSNISTTGDIVAMEYTGGASSSPVDGGSAVGYNSNVNASTGVGGGFNTTSNATVTATNGDLLTGFIAVVTYIGCSGTYFQTPWTCQSATDSNVGFGVGTQTQSTAGSVSFTTHDGTNNDTYTSAIVAFKPGSGSFNTYYDSCPTAPNQVFEDGARLSPAASKAAMTVGSFWYDSGATNLYVRMFADDSPSGHTIEASQRNYTAGISVNYITVSGLTFTKANIEGINYSSTLGSVITGSTISYNYDTGLFGSGTMTITGNTINYNGGAGIAGNTFSSSLISGNVVNNNDILETYADQAYEAGIKLSSPDSVNNTVQNNVVYLNGHGTTGALGDTQNRAGIWCDTCGAGNVIRYNLVYNNLKYGIYNEATYGTAIYGNIVYGNVEATAGNGYARGIEAGRGNQNVLVYNNTCYGNTIGLDAQGDNLATGIYQNNTFKNNISVANSLYQFMAVYGGENDGTNGSGNVYTYNDFGTAAASFIEWGNGTYFSTYALWEAATGNCGTTGCSHSTQTSPTLANAAGGQFWLTGGSPGIAAGTALGSPYNVGIYPGSSWPNSVFLVPNLNNDLGAFVYTGYAIDTATSYGTQASGTTK